MKHCKSTVGASLLAIAAVQLNQCRLARHYREQARSHIETSEICQTEVATFTGIPPTSIGLCALHA
jgi:hypothetical protein